MNKFVLALITTCLLSKASFAFELYGHRGARGLAPENTIPGYAVALQYGVDFVDMDVTMTKDGIVVLQHELSLDPNITRDKTGAWVSNRIPIKDLTFAELQEYDVGRIDPNSVYASYFPDQQPMDGTPMPSLDQVIDYVKEHGGDQIKFQIEIKSDPNHPQGSYSPRELAQAVAEVIHKQAITDRVEVQSFDWQCLLELQQIDANIPTAYITSAKTEEDIQSSDPAIAGLWTGGYLVKDYNNSIPFMIKQLGGTLWDPQDITLTEKKVHEAHAQGLRVVTWSSPSTSSNDFDLDLVKQQITMGVDGIITDRPDKIRLIK